MNSIFTCYQQRLGLAVFLSTAILLCSLAAEPPKPDPYHAFSFKLLIDGKEAARFTECGGLATTVDSVRYRQNGTGAVIRKLPGKVEYGDVTLRRGVTRDKSLVSWIMKTVRGEVTRKKISILLMDNDGKTVAIRWNLRDAWPSGWEPASGDSQSQETALESVTFSFEALERENGSEGEKGPRESKTKNGGRQEGKAERPAKP